ncbi:hypothetical protein [Streptomyces olivaceiscleroticus]|uniref:Uncharacterized protein n=1 Tax=Streptomyces olivaceiscleroticus TaxID=68245 RepID=A0ABP3LHR2_9ACTN
MTTRVRHQAPPPPNGCRWCGIEQRGHARRWVTSRGFHTWEQPTQAQRLARMRARRNAKADRVLDKRLNALKEKP